MSGSEENSSLITHTPARLTGHRPAVPSGRFPVEGSLWTWLAREVLAEEVFTMELVTLDLPTMELPTMELPTANCSVIRGEEVAYSDLPDRREGSTRLGSTSPTS